MAYSVLNTEKDLCHEDSSRTHAFSILSYHVKMLLIKGNKLSYKERGVTPLKLLR